MVKQNRAAAVHFKVEVTFRVDRLDEKFHTTVVTNLFLIVAGAGNDVLIFHLKHTADTLIVIEHTDTDVRRIISAAIKAVIDFQFIGTLPQFRIPPRIQCDGLCGTFHGVSITHSHSS